METAILWHTGPLIDEVEIAQVHELAAAAERADGVAPLSEQPLLNLREATDDVVHLLTWRVGALAGYAQVDKRGEAPSAELVVHPAHRRHGLGFHLLGSAADRAAEPVPSADGPTEGTDTGASDPGHDRAPAADGRPSLRVWAHGDLPAARGLATRAGYAVVRELLVLERPLGAADRPAPAVPDGLRLREFVPGADDEAWVRANALAFAHHPEQGRLTVADLHARAREDWFDPAGLLLLERAPSGAEPDAAPQLVGFVWTKIPTGQPDDAREGEIYVVGVVPAAQGGGLGGLLTAVGLAHLAGRGATTAVLYVDGDNVAAVRTYERAGFSRRAVHVQYSRAVPPTGR